MTSLESSQFYSKEHRTDIRALVGSYAYEFLPMALPENPAKFNSMFSLCCGYGLDMVGARIHFGDTIRLVGIDNDEEMLRKNDKKRELQLSLDASGADFMLVDVKDINTILISKGEPDIIAVRHPGPMTDKEKVQDILSMLLPWMEYAVTANKIMIVSVLRFQSDVEGRNILAAAARNIAGDANIQLLKKSGTQYSWKSWGGFSIFEPDYYGFRIN